MSFRRDRDAERAWRRWVSAHRDELIAVGIPREVWADRMTWGRFVEHGHHPPASSARDVRFRVSDLPDERRRRLYRFLDATLPEARGGCSLGLMLRSQFGPADDSRA